MFRNKRLILILILTVFSCATKTNGQCVNMWGADQQASTLNLCPVQTKSGELCNFPFVWNNIQYYTCTIQGPNNPNYQPQCLTTKNTWSFCNVPTDAVVTSVNSRKTGFSDRIGLNGGTLLWISGFRFATNLFSITPTTATSNEVVLTNGISTYSCEIHPDKVTSSQITCYTPPMPSGTYTVRVSVSGSLIPLYQHRTEIKIRVLDANTPKINSIYPTVGTPGSLIKINGNFRTTCYTRDVPECGDDSGVRIVRIYFGGQICDLVEPDTNNLYGDLSLTSLTCKITSNQVGLFNVSMLVNGEYGRSLQSSDMFYVAANERIYNYIAYPRIENVEPKIGSIEGGTYVKITGKYLPRNSQIEISGRACTVEDHVEADNSGTSSITCITSNKPTEYDNYGNRGITLIKENKYYSFEELPEAEPSQDSDLTYLESASYKDTQREDITVWMKGFIAPAVTSVYEISLSTNGFGILFLSTEKTYQNKTQIATANSRSSQLLEANKTYYIEAVSSRRSGQLTLDINAKMLNTNLNDQVSKYVLNEIQEISITSTIVFESFKFVFEDYIPGNGVSEKQRVTIKYNNSAQFFILAFDGASTMRLELTSNSAQLNQALKDLPTLQPNLVAVGHVETGNQLLSFVLTFTPDLGDVPNIREISGNVDFQVDEMVKGSPSGKQFQFVIQGNVSPFIQTNVSESRIRESFDQTFGIRCPASVQVIDRLTTFALYDYEQCQYDNTPVEEIAFCGKCSQKNNPVLISQLNSSMTYNQLCFAYKLKQQPLKYLTLQVYNRLNGQITNVNAQIETISDSNWHYACHDIYAAYRSAEQSPATANNLILLQASVGPAVSYYYFDVVSLRNTLPFAYDDRDGLLLTTRRLFPNLQIAYNTLNVISDRNKYIQLSYRPTNCSYNLDDVELRQKFDEDLSPELIKVSEASPPVTGTFDISWNGVNITGINADVSEYELTNYLQAMEGFGEVTIKRSGDCSGYKWNLKWRSGGDKPPLQLTSNLEGNNVKIVSTTIQNGGVNFFPLKGDILRTYNLKPQVVLKADDIIAECGNSCDFEWSEEATPVVTSIDISDPESVIIEGSGFDEVNIINNMVNIGPAECIVLSATSTMITCEIGPGPSGVYDFNVNVISKGLARINSPVSYEFTLKLSSFEPKSSIIGGGNDLIIHGSGFSKETIVLIDDIECKIKDLTFSEITCIVPENPTEQDKEVIIEVKNDKESQLFAETFKYDAENSPVVTKITPTVLSVKGEEIITIEGKNLPILPKVYIGPKGCRILSSTSESMVLLTPSLDPGLFPLIIPVDPIGNVRVSTLLEYKFYVSSLTNNRFSIRGGSDVEIHGEGFSTNCQENKVFFGETGCQIKSCDSSLIKCTVGAGYKTYKINNLGVHPEYGTGYNWNVPYLKINKGEIVEWTWMTARGVSGINYQVSQVSNEISTENIGFTSGSSTPSGSFTYQFNKPGTYHYWSGYVDTARTLSFRGVIVVYDKIDDVVQEVNVQINNINAQKCAFPFVYKSVTYNDCTNVDQPFNWCSPTPVFSGQFLKCNFNEDESINYQERTENGEEFSSSLSTEIEQTKETISEDFEYSESTLSDYTYDTSETTLVTSDSNQDDCELLIPMLSRYEAIFTSCETPVVYSINPNIISYNTLITFNGFGFDEASSENKVLIGDSDCEIESVNFENITCRLGLNSGLIAGLSYGFEIFAGGKGYAIQDDEFKFYFQPVIFNITPTEGSIYGGTKVEIHGDGFDPRFTSILMDNYQFLHGKSAQINYNSISFVTYSKGLAGKEIADIIITVNGVEAFCGSNVTCKFKYSVESTPVVDSVSPHEISGPDVITLSGKNFGENKDLTRISIGSLECEVLNVTDEEINCQVNGLNLGENSVELNIEDRGDSAPLSLSITGLPKITSITPNTGSIHGGTEITVIGNGFSELTEIKLDSIPCDVKEYDLLKVVCITREQEPKNASISISVNTTIYDTDEYIFEYSELITPIIDSVTPESIIDPRNTEIVISGSNFGDIEDNVQVTIGDVECQITTVSITEIKCLLEENKAGSYPVKVLVSNIGFSNKNIHFKYELKIDDINPKEGGVGGGLDLTILGNGFSPTTSVLICDKPCNVVSSSFTSVVCKVPESSIIDQDSTCEVKINENDQSQLTSFTYIFGQTPKITDAYPKRGGSGGGTRLTILGDNFPLDASDVVVSIAGSSCDVISIEPDKIICETGSYSYSSVKGLIKVFVDQTGYALNDNVYYEYIDLWSSIWTWGGNIPPIAGDLVVIGQSQTVYFDTATPVLKGVIIQGGSLIFDDNQDVSLNAEYILITDGGKLQIGTEEIPFNHRAVITLYGTPGSIELPIYGSKVLALRNGTLDIHGQPVGVTWTHLGSTALKGSDQITLKEPVIWKIGSEIVIATTGNYLSIGQSETRKIIEKSDDNMTLILDLPLKYDHLCETRIVDGVEVKIEAEVGLLTRNVLFTGNRDHTLDYVTAVEECPDGFNPGEFAVQTCYLGRFGEESGNDQFGATIMVASDMNHPNRLGSVIARISNLELFHVGQAFRIGRYPIHFHLNGDLPGSYVKESAIHESFNRALNCHGSNYVLIERNVIYDIMGGAFFLEDGVEIGNQFNYNLAVFVRSSSALLNEDVTPAAFWATNPNNTYQHNAVAGSSHFGYWYRILDRPDGPSYNPNYCPKKIPMGVFTNNSVHSSGRFGLWVFPGYTPSRTGSCNDGSYSVASFEYLTAYGLDKGAEWVMSNPIQFRNFLIFDTRDAGIETKTIVFNENPNTNYASSFYSETLGSLVADSIIIGNSDINANKSLMRSGLVVAWDRGQLIKNISFYNFPDKNSVAIRPTEITGRCSFDCGGWTTKFSDMKFSNVYYRTNHRWDWDFIYEDTDGSISSPNSVVVSSNEITENMQNCHSEESHLNGVVCNKTKPWIRFSFNQLNPNAVLITHVKNINEKLVSIPYQQKRLTHPYGFMIALESNQKYYFTFDSAPYPTNVSYSAGVYSIMPGDHIIISHQMLKKPDQVSFGSSLQSNESRVPLTDSSPSGSWYWDNSISFLSYILSNSQRREPFLDYSISFRAIRCFYVNCLPPVHPADRLPVTARSPNAIFWSDPNSWSQIIVTPSDASFPRKNSIFPQDHDNIIIPEDVYLVVDTEMPIINHLQIDGILELDNMRDHKLVAEIIFINGGQLIIGWEKDPILTNVDIILTGTKKSEEFNLPGGFGTIGTKGIGVFGGLDIHGKPRNTVWTKLSEYVHAGDQKIQLDDDVDWNIGEKIVITTTTYRASHTEIAEIESKDGNRVLFLKAPLKYDHQSFYEYFDSTNSYRISAAVGLLTRNVKITGESYVNQEEDLFGSKVTVGSYSFIGPGQNPVFYRGFARVENCEFSKFGQFSKLSGGDLKYGILFTDLQQLSTNRPSYVRDSSFNYGYSTAVGIFASNSIPIENNVIYRTLDYSIRIEGHSNILRKNLVSMNYWSSTFLTYQAKLNMEYWGAIDAHLADSYVIEGNFVAGAERIGIYYKGDVCPGKSIGSGMTISVKDNIVYGAMIGVAVMPDFSLKNQNCVLLSGFTVYKSVYYGIYYQQETEVIVESNKLIDNKVNVFVMINKPNILTHQLSDKIYQIKNSLIVGESSGYDCINDQIPDDLNYQSAEKVEAYGSGDDFSGKIGVVWANFVSSSNKAPYKPWMGIMSYNTLDGLMQGSMLAFANFNKSICNDTVRNYALSTNFDNSDGQQPVVFKQIKLFNTENESKVFIHRPDHSLINPTDCVDMDCDGMKKCLFTDLDGSFLGSKGTVIPQSEYGWGSQRLGLGDFRIPREALYLTNGTVLHPNQTYKYPGIARDPDLCTYIDSWQGYFCKNLTHKLLIIESMDNDTESRRLSPVAIFTDNTYLDLINGPQDHGWCSGYTCQKRVSTFYAIVQDHRNYDIFFTGNLPLQLRFRLVDSDLSFKIRISVHYPRPKRIDIYKNGIFFNPTNVEYINGDMTLVDPSYNFDKYMPVYENISGTNFFNFDDKKVYFSMWGGSDYLEVIQAPVLIVTFGVPSMTEDEFFESENLVENFANLMGVPESKIRRVEIVRENSKKSSGISKISFTIFDNPISPLTNQDNLELMAKELRQISASISSRYATGELQKRAAEILNIELVTLDYDEPYSDEELKSASLINKLVMIQEPGLCNEQSPCQVQPKFAVIDENGLLVQNLGNMDYPWLLKATIIESSDESLKIIHQQEAPVINGFVNFTSLGVSKRAASFRFSFSFVAPIDVDQNFLNSFTVNSSVLSSSKGDFKCVINTDTYVLQQDQEFSLEVSIVDIFTLKPIQDINWIQGLQWFAEFTSSFMPVCSLNGGLERPNYAIEFTENVLKLNGLKFTGEGSYIILMSVYSAGQAYSFNCESELFIVSDKNTKLILEDQEPNVFVSFDSVYEANQNNEKYFKAAFYNCFIANNGIVIDSPIYVLDDNTISVSSSQSQSSISAYANLIDQLDNLKCTELICLKWYEVIGNKRSFLTTTEITSTSTESTPISITTSSQTSESTITDQSSTSKPSDKKADIGLIVGLTAGIIVIILIPLVFGIIYKCLRRKSKIIEVYPMKVIDREITEQHTA